MVYALVVAATSHEQDFEVMIENEDETKVAEELENEADEDEMK